MDGDLAVADQLQRAVEVVRVGVGDEDAEQRLVQRARRAVSAAMSATSRLVSTTTTPAGVSSRVEDRPATECPPLRMATCKPGEPLFSI
jgi:hypothetical protein